MRGDPKRPESTETAAPDERRPAGRHRPAALPERTDRRGLHYTLSNLAVGYYTVTLKFAELTDKDPGSG